MRRAAILVYSAFAYMTFLASIVWAIGFFANAYFPKTVDRGAVTGGPAALLIDTSLLLLFAVQHSVMARRSFKRIWARLVPEPAERSTYVLMASAILLLLFWQWRPLPTLVWRVDWAPAAAAITAVYVVGWVIAVSSIYTINPYDFVGLRQAYLFARQRAYTPLDLTERWLYAWIRHPIMLGLVIVFWATPRMSVGHLFFALASTAYIGLGTVLEERDLRSSLGETYRQYALRVPAFIPRSRIWRT